MMSVPPMVGVPALVAWLAGPSLRIAWPICSAESRRMSTGPSTSESVSAASPASRVRKVMYLKTLSGG